MVFAAAGASAGAPAATTGTASAVLESADGRRAMRGEAGAPGTLLPVVPGLVAGAAGAGVAASAGTIFYDGFEGGGSSWSVGGAPTWGITTYRAAAGQASAYCAGDPIGAPGPYADNMNAWLIAGPFDLSAVTAAVFSYDLYYSTEADRDFVQAMVSIDGVNFSGLQYSGATQGWADGGIDLGNVPTLGNVCGLSQVWIAFVFVSDSSITDEGAYVDEVRIAAGGGGSGEAVLVMDASPMTVPYHGAVDLGGTLRDAISGSLLADREVQWLWSQNDNVPRQWEVGGTVSSMSGVFSLRISPLVRRTYFVLVFPGDSEYATVESNYVKVMARAQLTPPAVPSRVRSLVKVTSWGTLRPQHKGGIGSHTKVYWERFTGGKWRAIVSLYAQSYRNTSSETKYGVTLMYAPGKWRVRAVHQDVDHAKTTSSWRTFTAY